MNTISITYTLYFQLSIANEYQFTRCKKCFNIKTGRMIKKVSNKGSIGYNIRGKFKSLKCLHNYLEKIPKQKTPW